MAEKMSTSSPGSVISTARMRRVYPQTRESDDSKAGSLRLVDGELCKGARVTGDTLVLDFGKFSGFYPDDALAIIRDMLIKLQQARPHPRNKQAIESLQMAIFRMDQRAVEIHGYSGDYEERDLTLPANYPKD